MKLKHDIREADSIVTLAGSSYHFVKNAAGDLVAEVADDHAELLLQKDEFSAYTDEEIEPPQGESTGGDGDPDDEDFGAPVGEDAAREAAAKAYEMKTLDELRGIYEQRFGKKAPPLMKHETMLERLVRDDMDKASKG